MLSLVVPVAFGQVPTVSELDLERYQGTWYELASYPTWFQRGCTATTATYTLLEDGRVGVVNRCRKGGLDGRRAVAVGRARQPDPSEPGKLEVSFFRPFWADYWVVDLDPGYGWVIVGTPDRDNLWILSRTPHVPEPELQALFERAAAAGFDPDRLERTVQP